MTLGVDPDCMRSGWHGAGPALWGSIFLSDRLTISRNSAAQAGLDIDYRHMNFLDMDFEHEFDVAIQIYGELCVFSNEMRDKLLRAVCRALKAGGVFIFDVTTRTLRTKKGISNRWYLSDGGFWRPGRHLVLEQGYDYPEKDVWLDQYIVIDEMGLKVYRNWYHDYSMETLEPVLKAAGFVVEKVWDDLTGTPYTGAGDWLAVAARRTG